VTVEVTSEVGKALLEEGIEPRDAAPLAAALEASGKTTPEAAMVRSVQKPVQALP
jgi:hypothetical protein